ncbi:MAG: SDR family NAD(P)-dependent oxidoreductase [Bacteroidia bacterium]|nr:SDR family NAD(P)-dependent oxidoreductase [Bacteroidia bacterium]
MTEANSSKVWLITGSNRGIGRAIAEEALENGDQVALGARDASSLADLIAKFPKQTLALNLDMDNPDQIEKAVPAVMERFGRLDILINNAGFGLQGMIEEVSMEQVRKQMETNFFGLVHLTRATLPVMRKQKRGYIVNVSSIAGLRGTASLGMYNASKFAVNGFSEALRQEVAPFGIRVSIVEPGPYRTDWSGNSLQRSVAMKESSSDSAYQETNSRFKSFFDGNSGKQPGDPRQIAKVLLAASRASNPPLHMVFGEPAIKAWEQQMEHFKNPEFMSFFPHDKTSL